MCMYRIWIDVCGHPTCKLRAATWSPSSHPASTCGAKGKGCLRGEAGRGSPVARAQQQVGVRVTWDASLPRDAPFQVRNCVTGVLVSRQHDFNRFYGPAVVHMKAHIIAVGRVSGARCAVRISTT
jgi:hypothetical protein